MSSLDPISVQKDEVTALRNIFGKEFKLIRPKNMKKKYEPLFISILINIDVPSSADIKFSLKMCFDCSIDYPLSSPTLSITDAVNIPLETQDDLKSILNQKSILLRGAPMIHNLVEEGREILLSKLEERPRESIIPNEVDILQTESKQSELKLQLLRQRHNSARNESKKEKKFEKCFHIYKNSGVVDFEHCSDKTTLQVYKGICEGQHRVKAINANQQLVFNVFQGFSPLKGSNMKIQQISLSNLSKKRFEYLQSNWLPKLEQDFSLLFKLTHPNLLPYLGFRVHTHEKQVRRKKHVDINIQYVTPNCGEMILSTLCEADVNGELGDDSSPKVRLPIHKVKSYLKGVLDAVLYLHENNITYIKTDIDSILIDKDQKVKICNYYIGKRFKELKEREKNEETHEDQSAVSSVKKGSRRHDIMKVAKLAKELFFYGVPEIEIDESDMPSDLIDFISSLESNIEDLNRHPFLCPENIDNRYDYQKGTFDTHHGLSPWDIFEKSSRIPREFELICMLGKGGFGDVVKVKNIYDNQYYAIKRVPLKAIKKKAARAMKEVQLLSSLNHENIVRYYASWAEEVQPQLSIVDNHTDTSSTKNNISHAKSIEKPDTVNSILEDLPKSRMNIPFSNSVSFLKTESRSRHFALESYSDSSDSSLSSSEESGNEINLQRHSSVDMISFCHEQSGVATAKYINESHSVKRNNAHKTEIDRYLMIQMELCEGPWNTLQKCIEEQKLYLNEKLIWRFIREIVSGLEHIHSKNMIHRDLKPNNIFIDHQKRVKIGDLGLAMNISTKINDRLNADTGDEHIVSSEKGPVGTTMYISPEMICNLSYTNKTDMYSLGIIIFEMCHKPFNTASERCHVLNSLRRPEIIFPNEEHFRIKSSFKQLLTLLLNHDPSKRPSASELLRSNIIPPPEGKEMELRRFLSEVTKTSNSNLYKFMLKELFSQLYSKDGRYELPLLYQSPFKYYLSNTKPQIIRVLKNSLPLEMDQGDYTFFTIKRLVTRYIESVFVSHGAVEFVPPLLSPSVGKNDSHVFSLLDSEGVVVYLPDNLRVNFANFLLNNDIISTKRYGISSIYQQQEYRRDHPRELIEAAFDIVSDYNSSNKTSEVLYVLHQIFNKIINFEHVTLNLEINHTGLFFGFMNFYKIPDELHWRILSQSHDEASSELVDYLDTDEFRKRTTLNDTQLANLKLILRYNGPLNDYEKYLKIFQNKAYENDCCESIIRAFNELRSIEKNLAGFQDNFCFSINICPSVVPLKSIYRGFVFQIMFHIDDRFFDLIKSSKNKNKKLKMRYLRNLSTSKLSSGGEYSSYLMTGHRPFVAENGDVPRNVFAVGASIDLSTLLQCVYSMEQLTLFNLDDDFQYESLMSSVVSVVVKYSVENDKAIRDLLAKLWAAGLAAELYDKDDIGEEYFFNQKSTFFVEFLNKNDKKSHGDSRIVVKKNDFKGVGLEQISGDDTSSTMRVVELIMKESKKNKENLINRLERNISVVTHRQTSDSSSTDQCADIDMKRCFIPKSESVTNQYIYKFISARENKFSVPDINLPYFVETNKHVQSLNQKNADLDVFQIQSIVKLNSQLAHMNKFFQGRLPNPVYNIIAEVSYSKCFPFIEEVSLKSLKEANKLSKIFSKIESSKNYSNNVEKQWKDVLSRLWEALQDAVKEKIFRILIFCQIDDHFVFCEIK